MKFASTSPLDSMVHSEVPVPRGRVQAKDYMIWV